jgi:hypothetical protein
MTPVLPSDIGNQELSTQSINVGVAGGGSKCRSAQKHVNHQVSGPASR